MFTFPFMFNFLDGTAMEEWCSKFSPSAMNNLRTEAHMWHIWLQRHVYMAWFWHSTINNTAYVQHL